MNQPRRGSRCRRSESYQTDRKSASRAAVPNRVASYPPPKGKNQPLNEPHKDPFDPRRQKGQRKSASGEEATHRVEPGPLPLERNQSLSERSEESIDPHSQRSEQSRQFLRRRQKSPKRARRKVAKDPISPGKSPKSITRDRSIVSTFPVGPKEHRRNACATDIPRTLDYFPKETGDSPEAVLFNMNGSKFDSLDLETAELEESSLESENHLESTNESVSQSIEAPRIISGSPGSRIRVSLGATGHNFLILIDEDDGIRSWQSKQWAGLPPMLEEKLREIGYIHQCSFAANGEDWFLSGKCTTTGADKRWWSVRSPKFHEALQRAVDGDLVIRVVFGDMEEDQYILLLGSNGYTLGSNLPRELLAVLDSIYQNETTIARVRGLNKEGTFLVEESVDGDDDDEVSDFTGIVRSVYHAQGLSPHLQSALETFVENQQDLHEIAMGATDSSWLIIRDDSWDGSIGIHEKLAVSLDEFYTRHRDRQRKAQEKASLFHEDQRLLEQQMLLLAAEKRLCEQLPSKHPKSATNDDEKLLRMEEAERNRQQRLERHKMMVAKVSDAAKKREEKEGRLTELAWKGLRPGNHVTVLGVSTKFGDVRIEGVDNLTGIIRVRLPPAAIKRNRRKSECSAVSVSSSMSLGETVIPIHDARRLAKLEPAVAFNENLEQAQLVAAADKYEAALTLFHGYSEEGSCVCKRDYFGFSQKYEHARKWKVGDRVHVIGYADGTVIPLQRDNRSSPCVHVEYDDQTSYHVLPDQLRPTTPSVPAVQCRFLQHNSVHEEPALRIRPEFEPVLQTRDFTIAPFDNFSCSEKIDVRRLQTLATNLRSDSSERSKLLDEFALRAETSSDTSKYEICYQILENCLDLEETVFSLYDVMKGQPLDEHGYFVHKVQYRHRDAAFRGRLFAVGHPVRLLPSKFPRTLTLQAVHSGLLATLCGAFCRYIDCENSDIRIICSLSAQLGLDTIIPTIIDYRNHRDKWIAAISQEHPDTTNDEVKRLANVILSGGSYEHWLKQVGEESVSKVRRFAFRLEVEAKAIRDRLLQHPRFQWICIERSDLKLHGSSKDESVKCILFQCILQSCENEILEIIHRTFHLRGWRVRAKLFDSVLIEPGPKALHEDIPLEDLLRIVERTCETKGWKTKLIEKPLLGLEDKPIVAIEEARSMLHAVNRAQELDSCDIDDIIDEMSRTSVGTEASNLSRVSGATDASNYL